MLPHYRDLAEANETDTALIRAAIDRGIKVVRDRFGHYGVNEESLPSGAAYEYERGSDATVSIVTKTDLDDLEDGDKVKADLMDELKIPNFDNFSPGSGHTPAPSPLNSPAPSRVPAKPLCILGESPDRTLQLGGGCSVVSSASGRVGAEDAVRAPLGRARTVIEKDDSSAVPSTCSVKTIERPRHASRSRSRSRGRNTSQAI